MSEEKNNEGKGVFTGRVEAKDVVHLPGVVHRVEDKERRLNVVERHRRKDADRCRQRLMTWHSKSRCSKRTGIGGVGLNAAVVETRRRVLHLKDAAHLLAVDVVVGAALDRVVEEEACFGRRESSKRRSQSAKNKGTNQIRARRQT